MVTLGSLALGAVPRIAAPLTDRDVRAAGEAVYRCADIIELRIDQFARHDPAYVGTLCRDAGARGLPLIATIRSVDEGGGTRLDDAQRLALFEAVLPMVAAVDVELRAPIRAQVVEQAHRAGKRAIVSYHNFSATPIDTDLTAIFDAAVLADADVVKIAAQARDAADADRLLVFLLERRHRAMIVIGMGPHGVASRVFFPLLGSLITYGSVGTATAPGQLPLAELHAALRRYSPEFAAAHPAV